MAKFKELKVGDTVGLDYVNWDHNLSCSDMGEYIGKTATVLSKDKHDKSVRVDFGGDEYGFWYKPKWLSQAHELKEIIEKNVVNHTELTICGGEVKISWKDQDGDEECLKFWDSLDGVEFYDSCNNNMCLYKKDLVKLHQAVTEALELLGNGEEGGN